MSDFETDIRSAAKAMSVLLVLVAIGCQQPVSRPTRPGATNVATPKPTADQTETLDRKSQAPKAKEHNWTLLQMAVITEYNSLMDEAKSALAKEKFNFAIDRVFSAKDLIDQKMDGFSKREYTDRLQEVAELKAKIIAANEKRNIELEKQAR